MLSPVARRVVQAILYEVIAVLAVGPLLSFVFDESAGSSFLLAFVMSTIALGWNYVFNTLFERWERGRAIKGRSFKRRLMHGLGFEGGLVIMLVPLMALWMDVSLLQAGIAQAGIFAFFFVYSLVFTWSFDRIFGLPASAAPPSSA
ncbi:MAG TPA: PACE efflux transporter [Polyangiaceae bacterium]|nr:PACE efflux transporter [Polyangiaceae bacterium]